MLVLTAKTIYIQLYVLLIFRYFFSGQNKKKMTILVVDSRLARDSRARSTSTGKYSAITVSLILCDTVNVKGPF